MTQDETTALLESLQDFQGKNIAVVGDVMVDIYHRGTVNRISPEAPVPVVSIDSVEHHPGGAANVAMNLKALGAEVDLLGVTGEDVNGDVLMSLLREAGIRIDGCVSDPDRPTTAKTRVIAGSQHVVRTDLETTNILSDRHREALVEFLKAGLSKYDAVILQDYNKGVLQPDTIRTIIKTCRSNDVIVTVDPKFQHFFEYRNATMVKPNLKEVESVLGRTVQTDGQIADAGKELIESLESDYLLVTLGARGMELFARYDTFERFPTQAKKVADVSGAGDTVIATVTLALAAGSDPKTAAILGNIAAGRVCEEVGIVPITVETLRNSISG
ncbi:MAG: D-glycero-beta-D-manno-heptose-7-phosphate kinase [Candidatus Marinimicrobia bacterium]|nr:D-glycero-beta-D-manno-heptose-7-phosphate kinase [Candidatus Neomarinimicrobiota bacterium]MCF7828156.1 D-glycero-beta-D-manno-heptose-7-phosphate kinase [Candidatus Neomarinimicrobiota bacterium]MCF7879669.1 D-glycero-beta-D-manno-heptose-7-phosphate kinase [Candidatus Neomarinimicrobiota bacterium]